MNFPPLPKRDDMMPWLQCRDGKPYKDGEPVTDKRGNHYRYEPGKHYIGVDGVVHILWVPEVKA